MARVYLRKEIKKRIEKGHPWVYKNEVDKIEDQLIKVKSF
ncbi:hypothetical protein [Petroclostridium xylanilyticum]|nr:hypothetical protein [Petroclostridium xylanilyticum]